jgi:hypothetical protein
MSAAEEPTDIDAWCADATLRLSPHDTAAKNLEEEVRALVRNKRQPKTAKPASETCDDVLTVGVTSIADIEKLMAELLVARDYLQSEGERVRHMNARYGHLAQTASASVKIIAESLGKWCNLETVSQAPTALPRAPTLATVPDGEPPNESNHQ